MSAFNRRIHGKIRELAKMISSDEEPWLTHRLDRRVRDHNLLVHALSVAREAAAAVSAAERFIEVYTRIAHAQAEGEIDADSCIYKIDTEVANLRAFIQTANTEGADP